MIAKHIITIESVNMARLRPTKGIGGFIAAVSVSHQHSKPLIKDQLARCHEVNKSRPKIQPQTKRTYMDINGASQVRRQTPLITIARVFPRGQTYRVPRLMYAIYESSVLAKNPMSRISHVGDKGFLVESYRDLLEPDRFNYVPLPSKVQSTHAGN